MLSIKHKTFNILNKYIEINGIGKITPTDVSRFVYAWDDKNRTTNLDNINIEQLNNISQLTYINHQVNASPVNSKLSQECNNTPMFKKDLLNNKLAQVNNSKKVPSTKSIEKNIQDPNNQQLPTEMDFSQLLTLMANPKQAVNTTSNNNNSRLQSNTNNQHTINDNEQHSNVKNTIENNIKENNEKESSHHSFAEDFFNNKQKTNNISDEGATIIITHDKESLLPSTLHHIFTENKAEQIREILKKNKIKENRRKIFSLGRKTAKLFKDYNILLLNKDQDKGKENYIQLGNKISSLSLNKDINNSSITPNQNKIFLEQIPEIYSEKDYLFNKFDKEDLVKEEVISFSFESIYQNINTSTNLEYSKNKIIQEKALKYINKLIENKNKGQISNINSVENLKPSQSSKSGLFSKSKESSFSEIIKLSESQSSDFQSDGLYNIKKFRLKRDQNKSNGILLNIENSLFSEEEKEDKKKVVSNSNVYNSVKPKKSKKLNNINKNSSPRKSKKLSKKLKKSDIKLTFKLESANEDISADDDNISKKRKSKRNSALKLKRESLFTQNESSSNNKNIKNSKTSKNLENKKYLTIEKRAKTRQKRRSYKTNLSKSDLEGENNKKEGEDKFEYFAQEKKDGCKIS